MAGTLATPEPIKNWSLTSLKEKLIKIGAKVVSHGRYVIFQMAEVAIPRQMFQEFCGSSQNCGRSHHQRQRETFDGHAFKSNRRQECVRVPGKWPDQILERHLGRLECREPAPTSGLGFWAIQKIATIQASSGDHQGNPVQATCVGLEDESRSSHRPLNLWADFLSLWDSKRN